LFLVGDFYEAFSRFQWPLIGHAAMRLLARWRSSQLGLRMFQWPLIGHAAMRRVERIRPCPEA